jgi:CRP/FNR family cyclic AMP-dependent transcriptional regulator
MHIALAKTITLLRATAISIRVILNPALKMSLACRLHPADAVFYIQKGKIKLAVVSDAGKEAVIALLDSGDFLGEGCLAAQPIRMATATAISDCVIVRLGKPAMIRVLHDEPAFSAMFLAYVLSRNMRVEADLVDQLFNSSEKRLARVLLLLAHFGKEGKPEPVVAKISQETLAEMIGTTRSRVSFFINRFRKLGFVEYNGGGLHVHSSLLNSKTASSALNMTTFAPIPTPSSDTATSVNPGDFARNRAA